jgi:hypothetical protein
VTLPATTAGLVEQREVEKRRLAGRVQSCLADNDLLGSFAALIALMDVVLPELAHDLQALGHGIENLDLLARQLRTLQDEAKKLARAWLEDHGQLAEPVEGVGILEQDRSLSRTEWRHGDLLAEAIRIGFAEGLITHPHELAKFLLSVFGSPSWKVGQRDRATGEWSGLRGLGIDPADWCVEDRKGTVRWKQGSR